MTTGDTHEVGPFSDTAIAVATHRFFSLQSILNDAELVSKNGCSIWLMSNQGVAFMRLIQHPLVGERSLRAEIVAIHRTGLRGLLKQYVSTSLNFEDKKPPSIFVNVHRSVLSSLGMLVLGKRQIGTPGVTGSRYIEDTDEKAMCLLEIQRTFSPCSPLIHARFNTLSGLEQRSLNQFDIRPMPDFMYTGVRNARFRLVEPES